MSALSSKEWRLLLSSLSLSFFLSLSPSFSLSPSLSLSSHRSSLPKRQKTVFLLFKIRVHLTLINYEVERYPHPPLPALHNTKLANQNQRHTKCFHSIFCFTSGGTFCDRPTWSNPDPGVIPSASARDSVCPRAQSTKLIFCLGNALPQYRLAVKLGYCKLENEILKEVKNLEKWQKMIILRQENVIFEPFWPFSKFHFPACATLLIK